MFDKLIRNEEYTKYIELPLRNNTIYVEYHPAIKAAIEYVCATQGDNLESIKLFEHKWDGGFNTKAKERAAKDGFVNYMGGITTVTLFLLFKLKNSVRDDAKSEIFLNNWRNTQHSGYISLMEE